VHGESGLVHEVGDVAALSAHITALHEDPAKLARMRAVARASAPTFTWRAAGERLLDAYREVVADRNPNSRLEREAA
jgi:glycosyltransferase involved in cell wall biosynthesis